MAEGLFQDAKVVNLLKNSETFFYDTMDASAIERALDYIEKNKNKFPMSLYRKGFASEQDSWVFIKTTVPFL